MASINDLRSALAVLEQHPQQLRIHTDTIDPRLELARLYKPLAGTPVAPPTQVGPALWCQSIKDSDASIITGVMASRQRCALLLDTSAERLPFTLLDALQSPIEPEMVRPDSAPCQQVVHTRDIDLMRLLPIPVSSRKDAGPYIGLGLLRAEDPETGASDVTIHRLCVQGKDELSVYFVPGRHIDQFRIKAEHMGKPLPVSINLGLDPAIYISACFEPPTTPLGFDELTIAGGWRGAAIELVNCVSVAAKAIARAEIVIEGEILPGERVREDQHGQQGYSMPEFPGYNGTAQPALPVIKVRAVTHRRQPIFQNIVGPGEEHVNLAGIPTEASIIEMVERAMPGLLQNVYCHSAGGGKYLACLQIRKRNAADEGRQRQAALVAFAAFSELKQVVLVDEDVDIFNPNEILWAMTTRYQGDVDTVFIPGVRCHPLDPSQSPDYSPSIRAPGNACKTIFDCTVPHALKERFVRADFG